MYKLSNELKSLQNKEANLESTLLEKESIISRLTSDLSSHRNQLQMIGGETEQKQSEILRLNNEITNLKGKQV